MTTANGIRWSSGLLRALGVFALVAASGCEKPTEDLVVLDCSKNNPGCSCEVEGESVACGDVVGESGDQLVCSRGQSVCEGGVWSACSLGNVTLAAKEGPGFEAQGFGGPETCKNNPCDPYCQSFYDTPTGAATGATGLIETPTGLTLPGSTTAGETACTGGAAAGSCGHSICSSGAKLTSGCDNPAAQTLTLLTDGFANNNLGWTLGTEWEIKAAATSSGHGMGNADPSADTTATTDNGVAGVKIGGNATQTTHAYYYMTSPAFNASVATGAITLAFKRRLNSDAAPKMVNVIEVYDGAAWVAAWTSTTAIADNAWQSITLDLTAYKNAAMRVRFGVKAGPTQPAKVSSWNIDDLTVTAAYQELGCVAKVCAASPSCCSSAWTAACAAKIEATCDIACASNAAGACVLCYNDDQDHDGDGFSGDQGDCRDCDPKVNPGAFDFAGNGKDEDCSGTADDEAASCDETLALASETPGDFPKAIELCRIATTTDPKKKWGVLSSALVQANGTAIPHNKSYGVLTQFGPSNIPQRGKKMAAFSSGTARAPADASWVNPNGQFGSFDQGKSCTYPTGFPKNASGCPNGSSSAYDSTGLKMDVRVPTNANSFSYKFNFFSSEYPEWVCTAYNDGFVALLTTGYVPANLASNYKNISFDSQNNPVSVNISFFTVTSGAKLTGTGMDGLCQGKICGGGTDWLQTSAPVVPGETITMQLSTWDTGDHKWDSVVLVDDWKWSVDPATIETKPPPPPPTTTYSDAWFVRDYDASGVCPVNSAITWTFWSWSTTTPTSSSIEFSVQTANTKTGLDLAPEDKMIFTNPPGPAALAGQAAVAKLGSPNTNSGSTFVDSTLVKNGRSRVSPHIRIKSHLKPSADKLSAPTLHSWNLQFDCTPSE